MNSEKVISLQERAVAKRKEGLRRRECNLCSHLFIMRSPFDRFCGTCKAEKDLFKFAEWLPNLSVAG